MRAAWRESRIEGSLVVRRARSLTHLLKSRSLALFLSPSHARALSLCLSCVCARACVTREEETSAMNPRAHQDMMTDTTALR